MTRNKFYIHLIEYADSRKMSVDSFRKLGRHVAAQAALGSAPEIALRLAWSHVTNPAEHSSWSDFGDGMEEVS